MKRLTATLRGQQAEAGKPEAGIATSPQELGCRGEWIDTTIGEQATLQRGIDITRAGQREGPVPVVSSGGVTSYHDTAAVSGPGVVLGRKGVVGSVYFVVCDYWPHDTTLWVKDFHGNDRRFVYYFFKWMAPRIAKMDVGSANPTLNRNHVHPIEIRWPPVPEQRAIAHILGALDDKIELNRWMNETLEAMARALFKSWFVDFDPVRAKAEGRDPGLPKHIADFFPDRFEDSELGDIPEGWEVKTIGDVAERVGMGPFGSSIKVETFVPEGVPIISGQHLNGFMLEDNKFNFITPEHAERLKNSNVHRGDVIFTHAGNIGQAAYIPKHSRYERYVISQRQFFMRCDLSQVTPTFIALFFNSPEGRHQLLANTSSSGVPSIARPVTYLRTIKIVIPPKLTLDVFEKLTSPILLRFRQNVDESDTLVALRDALLPKLISGELRLKDANAIPSWQPPMH